MMLDAGDGRRPGSGGMMPPMPNGSPMMGHGGDPGPMMPMNNGVNGMATPHHAMGNGMMNGHLGGMNMNNGPGMSGPMGSMGSMPMMGNGMQGGGGGGLPMGSAPMMGNGFVPNGGGMGGMPPMGMMGMEGGGRDVMPLGGIAPGSMQPGPLPMANGAHCNILEPSLPPAG